ncbi:MAG: hypothetical protein AAGF06_00305 [Pseudomonadota bacterium]
MSKKVEARIKTFIAFSHVGLYVQGAIFNPANILNVLTALMYSNSAMTLDPDSPNLQSLHYYLNTYLGYAMGDDTLGQQHINNLNNITHTYGPTKGSEGIVVGSMANMFLIQDDKVREGLTTLNGCNTISCRRNSSSAPFKEVGMQIAIAEGHARLGEMDKMTIAFDKARSYATQHNYPYPELIDTIYDDLTKTDGIIDQWNSPLAPFIRLGKIQLPLPPSAGKLACQSCHASGRQTINHYE